MFKYKDNIEFNYNFKRSVNISSSQNNCQTYKLTKLTFKLIESILEDKYNTNSFALIGSFGTGKSAFLLFLDLVLNKNTECINQLKRNKMLYKKYNNFINNKKIFILKFTGEYSSFKDFFRNTIKDNYENLPQTTSYINKTNYSIEKSLKILENEIKELGYTDIFFFFDEFGKLLSYGLNIGNKNDISDLQVISEYINNSTSLKLLITLHRNIKDYANNTMSLNYNEWTKIQGRFETILFEYSTLELIEIVSNSFSLKPNIIKKLTLVNKEYSNYNNEVYRQMFPLHPFTTIAISKLFSKYFQNNRSVYSFLFSNEPYSFKEFINKKRKHFSFYSLSNLYDYIFYLSRAYDIKIPNKEIWYLSNEYINKYNFSNLELNIIKIISLIQSYKLESDLKLDLSNITYSLLTENSVKNISNTLDSLIKKNLIFKTPYNEYGLINEANIDIYKELESEKLTLTNVNEVELINNLLSNENILAKNFFVTFGNTKFFSKLFIDVKNDSSNYKYKIIFFNENNSSINFKDNLNTYNILVPIKNYQEISNHLKEIEALNIIIRKFNTKLTLKTKNILKNMIAEKEFFIKSFFKFNNKKAFYKEKIISFNSKTTQQIMTDILKKTFNNSPIINNYTFNHSTRINVGILRKLFTAMLDNPNKEFFGIKKYPAEKALYLSVIRPSGIHKKVGENWVLSSPTKLNFNNIWLFIKNKLKKRILILKLVEILKAEPYGLNENSSLLIITLFVIVNKNNTFIFRENTYKYSLDHNLLINIVKAPHKFELKYIELSSLENNLFKTYLKITNNYKNTEYTRDSVKDVINKIYGSFNILPEYTKNTQKISSKAIELRKALLISKTPYEGLFNLFPKALGYTDLKNIDENEYIKDFKNSFNEIVSSYKDIMLELSTYIAEVFKLSVKHYPYDNEFKKINEILSKKTITSELKSFLDLFLNTHGFKDYINGVSIILNEKEVDNSYDNDIISLKIKLKELAKEMLSKLELSNLSGKDKEVRKLKLSLLENDINTTIIIRNNKLDELKKYIKNIQKEFPNNLNKEEKLYIMTELIKDELNDK